LGGGLRHRGTYFGRWRLNGGSGTGRYYCGGSGRYHYSGSGRYHCSDTGRYCYFRRGLREGPIVSFDVAGERGLFADDLDVVGDLFLSNLTAHQFRVQTHGKGTHIDTIPVSAPCDLYPRHNRGQSYCVQSLHNTCCIIPHLKGADMEIVVGGTPGTGGRKKNQDGEEKHGTGEVPHGARVSLCDHPGISRGLFNASIIASPPCVSMCSKIHTGPATDGSKVHSEAWHK